MSDDGVNTELRLLLGVQRVLGVPGALTAARVLGAAGEHAAVWLAVGTLGALADAPRRAEWVRGTGVVLAAHAVSVLAKRLVRRARPVHADLRVHPGPGGRWGMPSSHAASTTAAAVVFGRLLGTRATLALPPVMGLSRLLVGAHFPSDVLVGSAVGALAAAARGTVTR
ncbi:phosphatase PAP2 family protein [Georgenia sp. AZ-5]|uniref:phosphatase PAP2 family protein n=1 Tax=Georgenia sp. AZ-5 TaxID=3367526 RepID=UPI0037543492